MVILSIIYGSNHNSHSHKISENLLIQHLEKIDPSTTKKSRERNFGLGEWSLIIDLFCKQTYILKEKGNDQDGEAVDVLSLGPRAILEVGREQVITFTHEVVGQTIDQALLAEIKEEEEEEE